VYRAEKPPLTQLSGLFFGCCRVRRIGDERFKLVLLGAADATAGANGVSVAERHCGFLN
jgi:hypothetical protein